MAHNSRVRGSGDAWANILPSELATLDANLRSAWNGVDGGTYAPRSTIQIAGNGLGITGPLVIARGGQVVALNPGSIVFNASDFPKYGPGHPGMTPSYLIACAEGRGTFRGAWRCRFTDGGMQSVAPMVDLSDGNGPQVQRLLVPLRPYDSATLNSVTVSFRVGFAHTGLPQVFPGARVIRLVNGVIQPLTSQASGADASGFVYATASSLNAWQPAAGLQQITLPCDQNNLLSVSSYQYYVEILEEQWPAGTGYPFSVVYHPGVQACAAAPLGSFTAGIPQGSGFSTDGYTTSVGDRILIAYPSGSSLNGIWIVGVGPWVRATDLSQAGSYQGMVVPVEQGYSYGGSYMQLASTQTWTPGTQPGGTGIWSASTVYTTGWKNLPTAPHSTGFWYEATAGGTSGTTEPAWPTSPGLTVTDGGVTWQCIGAASSSVTFVGKPQQDDEVPGLQGTGFFGHGNIFQSVYLNMSGVVDARFP